MDMCVGDGQTALEAAADELRQNLAWGQTDVLRRVFEFLFQRSLEGRTAREVEIAQEVFGKFEGYDATTDASVRVHVHRLRRKLDEHYAGRPGARIVIPRGAYRIMLGEPIAISPEVPRAIVAPTGSRARRIGLIAGLSLLLVAGGYWAAHLKYSAGPPAASTGLWSPLMKDDRLKLVVTGDYYIFGEAAPGGSVTKLVRSFTINSRKDLDQAIMERPERNGNYLDLDLHYLPTSIAPALQRISPLLEAAAARSPTRPRVISMSQLPTDAIRNPDIVYVGFLSGLGELRDSVFDLSGFSIGSSFDELVDRKSGLHYMSDWENVVADRTPRLDYAYIAALPGPTGNRIIVIAGTRDAAVMQAAEIASDPHQLAAIPDDVSKANSFEALFAVKTLGNQNLSSRLVLARRTKSTTL